MKTCRQLGFFAALTVLSLFLPRAAAWAGEKPTLLTIDAIPTPITNANVGDWVEYKFASGNKSRITVIRRWEDEEDVYIAIENVVTNSKGKTVRRGEEEIKVSETVKTQRNLNPGDWVTNAEIMLHGRTLKTVLVNYVENGKIARQSHFTNKIPIWGLAQGVTPQAKVKVSMAVVDYGFAEE